MFLFQAIFLLQVFIYEIQSRKYLKAFEKAVADRCPSIPVLDVKKIKQQTLLGQGGFGTVHLTEYQGDEETETRHYAWKVIQIESDKSAVGAAKEICKMYNMKNAPHVAQVLGAGTYSDSLGEIAFFSMEVYDNNLKEIVNDIYFGSKSLYATSIYKKKYRFLPKLRENEARWTTWLRHVLYQLALAVKETHDNGIIHLDIKPLNFLVRFPSSTDPGHIIVPEVALSDFGLARNMSHLLDENRRTYPVGTFEYMAPEIFEPFQKAIKKEWRIGLGRKHMADTISWVVQPTLKSDIYSLGVTFHRLSTGKLPFFSVGSSMTSRALSGDGPRCKKVDSTLCDLITWMIKRNPKDRPTTNEVLDHKFFEKVRQHYESN